MIAREHDPALVAQAIHDVTCPEVPECRDRLLHTAAQVLAHTGVLTQFLRRLDELERPRPAEVARIDPDAWGDPVEGPPSLVGEIAQMERLAEELYRRARRMRDLGRHLAASGVEAAAFTLVGEADSHRDQMRAKKAR